MVVEALLCGYRHNNTGESLVIIINIEGIKRMLKISMSSDSPDWSAFLVSFATYCSSMSVIELSILYQSRVSQYSTVFNLLPNSL